MSSHSKDNNNDDINIDDENVGNDDSYFEHINDIGKNQSSKQGEKSAKVHLNFGQCRFRSPADIIYHGKKETPELSSV